MCSIYSYFEVVLFWVLGILFALVLIIALSLLSRDFEMQNLLDSGKITEEQYCIQKYGERKQQNISGKCLKYFK